MKNSKLLGISIYLFGIVLANLLCFSFVNEYTPTFWINYGYTIVVFIVTLLLWIYIWKKPLSPEEKFMSMPAFIISITHLILQLILCIIFSLGSAVISIKVVIFINSFLFIIIWASILISFISKNTIAKVNRRQIDHRKKF